MLCINVSFLDKFHSVALALVSEGLFNGLKEVFQRLDGLETGLKSQGKQNNLSITLYIILSNNSREELS